MEKVKHKRFAFYAGSTTEEKRNYIATEVAAARRPVEIEIGVLGTNMRYTGAQTQMLLADSFTLYYDEP